MIKLSNLVLDEIKLSRKEKSILVKGLSTDSRSIRKGYLFAVLTNNDVQKGKSTHIIKRFEYFIGKVASK